MGTQGHSHHCTQQPGLAFPAARARNVALGSPTALGDAIPPMGLEREGFACNAWERVEKATWGISHIPATAHFPR